MDRKSAYEAGITLVELMVVVTILAVSLMLAVPLFTKDRIESEFNKFVRTFAHDLRRSHAEAIGSRDDRQFIISGDRYQIRALTHTTAGAVPNLLVTRTAPEGVAITGVINQAVEPGMTYTPPTGGMSGSFEIRLAATGGLEVETSAGSGNVAPNSATVYFRTLRGNHYARIVIYQATCHAKLYQQW